MRENTAAVQDTLLACQELLFKATVLLKILDPELGDQELISSVEAARANLREMAGEAQPQQLPGGA